MAGWITLDRDITDHWLWVSSDPFDERSAWIDLLLLANHKEGKIRENGFLIQINRGQHKTSIRKLAARWHWSEGKVRRFLDALEADGMIARLSTTNGTLLTIVNYDKRQSSRHTDRHADRHTHDIANGYTDEHTDRHTDGRQTTMNNNVNNEEQIEPAAPVSTETWEEEWRRLNEEADDE